MALGRHVDLVSSRAIKPSYWKRIEPELIDARATSDLLVQDMLDAIRKIELYNAGLDYQVFFNDEKTIDAVARNLEILGEAARQATA